MNRVSFWVLLVAGALPGHPLEAAPPPAEAFGRVPAMDGVALSPNGKLIAWEDYSGPRPAVLVIDLDARKRLGSFPVAEGTKLRSVRFSDDTTLLITLSMTQSMRMNFNRKHTNEWWRTMAVSLETGESRVLLMEDAGAELVTAATLLAPRSARPGTVVMARWNWEATAGRSAAGTRIANRRQDSAWVYSVFAVDTRSGRGSILEQGTQFTHDWLLDATGKPVARSEWDAAKRRFSIAVKDGMRWRTVHSQEGPDPLRFAGLTADGSAALAVGSNGQATEKLWTIPLDGTGARAFMEHPERDVSVFFDPFDWTPVGVYFEGASLERKWLDAKAEARWKAVAGAFPGRNVYMVGRSQDYQRVLAEVDSPSHPSTYYLIDFKTGNADIVGEAYPGLADVALGEVRSITYAARDGAQIPAYVTLPRGAGDKNLPLVVLPHGGPEARDYHVFDWWAQFLASRGYVVLQPQFRGSTGFGEAHRKAGYRQWGGLMQDDVTDGVKALIAQGLADPRRVCIVGASYGGYAALAGAAFTPELYACAASINGVSDLPLMIGWEERETGDESNVSYYLREHIGDKNDPKVAAKSPARSAATIRAPVLLMHGVDDTVVPIAQSNRMYEALDARQHPVKLVKLPGEDHWLSASDTRIRVLTELEAFLAENLGAPTPPAAATAGSSN